MKWRFGLLSLVCSCSSGEPAVSHVTSSLPPGVVARTGSELVLSSTVMRVASRRGISALAARDLAVTDAVLAAAARDQLPPGTVRTVERAAAARAVLELMAREVAALPPPTAAELNEVRDERWVELDRPDAVRTTHAVVLNDKPERAARARLVAEKLAQALASVTTGAELIGIATAFPAEGFEVRAEGLPFVTVDGRTFARTETGLAARPSHFDPAFAKAANALTEVGKLGPIIESSFGYHCILLEERMGGVSTPPEALATLLGPEVQARRGSKKRRELLNKLRPGVKVEVTRAAEDLTGRVTISP
jgi:hypothetical protein